MRARCPRRARPCRPARKRQELRCIPATVMGHRADGASQHGAEKKAGAEDSTRVAGGIADRDANELEHHQQQHQLERHRSVQGLPT